jgi:hypothetical protein
LLAAILCEIMGVKHIAFLLAMKKIYGNYPQQLVLIFTAFIFMRKPSERFI